MRAKSDELTVMFCDMSGFTTLSEQMDPAQLQHLLNQVFSELTRLIGANRGTVDKYMGDCVMAFWGAPVESPMHAQLAVKTAVEMTQALGRINKTHKAGALSHVNVDIALGIGLNTGQMYVGDMGSNIRRSYTVIGDAVNLGSRLEGLSKVYGVSIVVSASTKELATDFVWQELDLVRVKGKQQAIAIFSPAASKGQISVALSDELALWHTFLAAYRAQDRAQSDALMHQLRQLAPNKALYALYAQRIALTRDQSVDRDWDGVTNFESK
jgi:adenylate cyclase